MSTATESTDQGGIASAIWVAKSLATLTFLVLSALATGASWVCYFRALKIGDASKVAPVDKLSVVLVVVFAVAFLGERLTLKSSLGAACIALGAIVMAL